MQGGRGCRPAHGQACRALEACSKWTSLTSGCGPLRVAIPCLWLQAGPQRCQHIARSFRSALQQRSAGGGGGVRRVVAGTARGGAAGQRALQQGWEQSPRACPPFPSQSNSTPKVHAPATHPHKASQRRQPVAVRLLDTLQRLLLTCEAQAGQTHQFVSGYVHAQTLHSLAHPKPDLHCASSGPRAQRPPLQWPQGSPSQPAPYPTPAR